MEGWKLIRMTDGSVFAVAVFDGAELPDALKATTRYVYDVFGVRPVLANVVTLVPSVAIAEKGPVAFAERSTR